MVTYTTSPQHTLFIPSLYSSSQPNPSRTICRRQYPPGYEQKPKYESQSNEHTNLVHQAPNYRSQLHLIPPSDKPHTRNLLRIRTLSLYVQLAINIEGHGRSLLLGGIHTNSQVAPLVVAHYDHHTQQSSPYTLTPQDHYYTHLQRS